MTSGPVFKGDTVTAYDVGDADHVYPSRGTDNRFMVNLLFMVFFFVLGTLAFIQGVKSYRRVDANAALWRRLNEPHPWSKELPETEE